MKIIIYSHPPNAGTGFATVTKNLIKHLSKEHEIFVVPVAGYQGLPMKLEDFTMLTSPGPVATSARWTIEWAKRISADVIIQHFDVWMLKAAWAKDAPCKVITYAPVDCTPLPDNFVESCEGAYTNVAMSHFAEKHFKAVNMPVEYIPHGVDTTLFKKVANAREQIGLPEDKFIVGIVATNGSIRKNLGGQLTAFAKFAQKKDVLLYMHTQAKRSNNEAIDLLYLVNKLGIEDKVIFSDPDSYAIGVPEEVMPMIYSCFDVLLQCSLGEGFGLPILEAQACDVPIIGTDCSAIKEVIGGGGLTVNATLLFMPYYLSNIAVPDINDIIEKLSYMHNQKTCGDFKRWQKHAVENAETYDWSHIFPLWDKLLNTV